MSFATFKCDACPATAEGEWDGLEGENAPAGWVTITKTPLDRSRIGGHRGGATSETLCPECHAKRDTTAARLAELEEKILGLGREARAIVEIPRRHGMSRGVGTTWYAQGPEERDA